MRALLCRQAVQGCSHWRQCRLALPEHFFTRALGEISGHEPTDRTAPYRVPAATQASWPLSAQPISWHGRTFASSAGDNSGEGPPSPSRSSLSEGEQKQLETFYHQVWGADADPPTPEEMEVLPVLRQRFYQLYGSAALPTAAAIQEIFDDYCRTLESATETESPSTEPTPARPLTEEEALAMLDPDEVLEEYEFTEEEMAQVEAISRAPKRVQRLALQQDLKALMRDPHDEVTEKQEGEEEGEGEDQEKMERVFDMRTVSIHRTCKKNKGGGLFRFQAFVVIGNGDGVIGYGMGKAPEVVGAIDKAYLNAERNLYYVERYRRHTIFEETQGKCTKTKVKVWPRPSGSGIRCNDTLANICDLAGIKDIRAKVHGSRHKMNMVKAFFQALDKQRTPEEIAREKGLVAREVAGALR